MGGRTAGSSLPRASPALWQPHLQSDSDDDSVNNGENENDGYGGGDSVRHRDINSHDDGDRDMNYEGREDSDRGIDKH